MDPNLISHQFSAQPTRKDKTNPKVNYTKSVKKQMLINRHISVGANWDARL